MAAGQLWRFAHEVRPGDRVATYDPRARSYLCGVVTGDFRHEASEENEQLVNQRAVRTQQREDWLVRFPPRSGSLPLV